MRIKFLLPLIVSSVFILSLFLFDHEPVKPLKTSGALKSLQVWTDQRAYPYNDIPAKAYYEAFTYKALNKDARVEMLTPEWQSMGPHNIGGRTIALDINPQNPLTIYAGAASGGLWRSFTEGKGASAWHKIETGYPVKSVGAIAVNPADTNIIYIGTGEVYGYQQSIGGVAVRTTRGSYGIGILKSSDGGASWQKSLDWSIDQRRGVQVIRLNPLNPNSVWAGTSEGTYRSLNGGKTWQQVHSTIMVTDLQINPLDTNQVIIACGNLYSAGHGFYKSTNYGTNWSKITAGLPASYGGKALFSVYKSNPNLVYASIGFGSYSGAGTNLNKSTDFGTTWTNVSTFDYSTYQGWFAHAVAVHPYDSSKVIASGIDTYKSVNGGVTLAQKSYWSNWFLGVTQPGEPEGPPDYSHADHHAIAWHPTNPDIIYFGTDGGIFCSTDGGETFSGRNGGYQTQQFYAGFSASFDDSLLAMGGLQDNATAIYQGTKAWNRVIGGDGCMTAIDQSNNNILYGTYQYGNILKSTNGGEWFSYAAPQGGDAAFVAPFAISIQNPEILYAGRTDIYKTTDGADTWNIVNSAPFDGNLFISLAISPGNDNIVYAATAPVNSRSNVYVTQNGGSQWSNITGSLPDRYPMDIAVDPIDPQTAYIVFAGFGTSHIYKTTNSGAEWTDVTGTIPDVPANAVAVDFDNSSHVYLGNDLGVYISTNGGADWSIYEAGLPEAAIVMDLTISPSDNSIIAATHGNGVYKRKLLSAVAVKEEEIVVNTFRLEQNYPNPFNPETRISFSLLEAGPVKLEIYSLSGQLVETIFNGQLNPGRHEYTFNAPRLASGVYIYKLNAEGKSLSQKMILLK